MHEQNYFPRLLDGCKRHDRHSQSELYRLFYRYVMTVALPFSSSENDAREAVNDAFFRVFTSIDRYDPAQPFKPWIRKVALRSAIDRFRKNNTNRHGLHSETSLDDLAEAPFDACIFEKMGADDLLETCQKLPPAYRAVLHLWAIEGMGHAEIAAALGISEGASKSNLFKARARLQALLAERETIKTAVP